MRKGPSIHLFGLASAATSAGYGVVFALLDQYRDIDHIGGGALGAVIGIGFLAGFLAQIAIAPQADRGHARTLITGGLALYVAGLVAMAAAHSVAPLLVGRFVMGVGVGMVNPAIRRIVVLSDRDRIGDNLGRMLAYDVGGFAAGPAIAAILVGPFGVGAPYLVIAGVCAVFGIAVQRTHVPETVEPARQRFAVDLLRQRSFTAAALMGAVLFVMIGVFDALWSLSLDDLGATEWTANVGLIMFALPLVVLGPSGGRLAQRIGPFRFGVIGLSAGVLFMASYGIAPGVWWMLGIAVVHAISDGLTVSSSSVAVAMVVPDERQAGGQGVTGAFQALAGGLTAPAVGALYEHYGRATAYLAGAGAVAALLAATAWLARPSWRLRATPG